MRLLTAIDRLAEIRGPKILIAGQTAVGKTSLLKTSFVGIAVDDAAGRSRGRRSSRRGLAGRVHSPADLARSVAISLSPLAGRTRRERPGAPYSQAHYDRVIADSRLASLAQFNIIFVDSYTELSRRCRAWGEQQPEAFNAYGKKDLRGAYGLVGRELIGWTQQLQHAASRTIVLVAILEKVIDDRGAPSWQIQLEGQRTRRELPAILDVIVTMIWVTFKDGKPRRAFVCQSDNSWHIPRKTAPVGSIKSKSRTWRNC